MPDINYITINGLERLKRELEWLQKVERPRITAEVSHAASLGDRSENAEYIYGKKRLREIDRRMHFLLGRLENVQAIAPGKILSEKVVIGATVVLSDTNGEEKTWRIYGEDEVDIDAGILSWKAPLSRSLLGKSVGDAAKYETPSGEREVEILGVRYDTQAPLPPNEHTLPS